MKNYVNFSSIVGMTPKSIQCGDESLEIEMIDGSRYVMEHEQDCCESVRIEDITGDLTDLLGTPILVAEERVSEREDTSWGTSTWTFYELRNHVGSVTIRWFGESNGYYSESVDFFKTN